MTLRKIDENMIDDKFTKKVKDLEVKSDDVVSQLADTAKVWISVASPPFPLIAPKGDGVIDDTASIQAILNYAKQSSAHVMFQPRKRYRTTYTLLYGSNISINGNGATIFYDTKQRDGTALVSESYDGTSTTENVLIENLTIETNALNGNGIGTPKANFITVRRCKTTSLYWHLVDIAGASNITIENCFAKNTKAAAYQIDNLSVAGGLYVELANHTLVSSAVDATVSDNIVIKGNVAVDCVRGIHLHRTGGRRVSILDNFLLDCTEGIFGDANTDWDTVIIKGNIIENALNSAKNGIVLSGRYTGLIIAQNAVLNCQTGISVKQFDSIMTENTKGIVVVNNIVRNAITRGISVDYCSGVVSGNTIDNTGYNRDAGAFTQTNTKTTTTAIALSVFGCDDMLVGDNIIQNTKGVAIALRDLTINTKVKDNILTNFANGIYVKNDIGNGVKLDIEGNKLLGGGFSFWGIYIAKGNRLNIDNNRAENIKYDGIAVDNAVNVSISDNFVSGDPGSYSGISIFNCDNGTLHSNNVDGGFEQKYDIKGTSKNINCEVQLPIKIGEVTNIIMKHKGTSPPVSNYYSQGSRVENESPNAGGYLGWVCVATGTPGTWKGYGLIQA